MNQRKMSIDEITKIADDVRLIQNFSENHNFNAGLFNAAVSPSGSSIHAFDWPLISAGVSVLFLILAIALFNFNDGLAVRATNFVVVLCLIFGGVATMSVHKRFENLTLTLIAGGVLLLVILIGCGIFTPREAVSEARKYIDSKGDK